VEDDARDGVAAFVAVEPDACCAAQLLAVDPAEQVQRLGDPTELADGTAEAGGSAAALQDAQQL